MLKCQQLLERRSKSIAECSIESKLNNGKKYCRMLPMEHSAILLTFIKLSYVIKLFVLSIFECPF